MKPWLTLVGIGEDGYPGLGKAARRALLAATRIVGAPRQLALLPPCISGSNASWRGAPRAAGSHAHRRRAALPRPG